MLSLDIQEGHNNGLDSSGGEDDHENSAHPATLTPDDGLRELQEYVSIVGDDPASQASDDECSEIDILGGQETLLTNDEGLRLAPGEGFNPVALLMDTDTEFLAFPTIFGGHNMKPAEANGRCLSYSDFCKSMARRHDRRAVSNVSC